MQTGIAFPSFTCLGDTPPFENKNERTTYLCIPYRRFYFLEPRFPLFLRKALSRGALGLAAKIHLFRRRGSGAQGSRLAQGDAWQKCDFAALYYTLLCKYCEEVSRTDGKVTLRHIRVQRHAAGFGRRDITLCCVRVARSKPDRRKSDFKARSGVERPALPSRFRSSKSAVFGGGILHFAVEALRRD